jgi:hypothetical protein
MLEALFETGAFPGAFPQEIQAGAADLCVPVNDHFLDPGGACQEGAFDADPVAGGAPHGEGGVVAAAADEKDSALKNLNAFPVTLFDLEVDADGVAGRKFGNIFIHRGFNGFQKLGLIHLTFLC